MGECRSIYLNACAEIASAFTDHGFRYVKSRQELVKKETDLTFGIKFSSDPGNSLVDHPVDDPGFSPDDSNVFPSPEEDERERSIYGSVTLYVYAGVHSKTMQNWRLSLAHPLTTLRATLGTYLGHLVGDGRKWLVVNLASDRTRPGRIRTIVDLIRKAALPYFERFRDPQGIVALLPNASVPGLSLEAALEYASCHGGRQAAAAILDRSLKDAPDYFHEGYQESLQKYRQNGLPAPNTYVGTPTGAQMAFAALALGLEPLERRRW